MSQLYADAGVDMHAGDSLVEKIKPFAKKTLRPEVLNGIGGFGALFELGQKYKNPVLVSGTDGVGTKLKLAFQCNQHATIGQDLVAMSVNDILVQGAEPLFFLDYFACGKLDVETAATVIQGIAKGCELSGCSLIGGETAEMPSMYPAGEYDLAGFAVGAVEKEHLITGQTIQAGDVIIALGSSGIHSNGYSLVRRLIEKNQLDLNAPFDTIGQDTRSLQDAVMEPTIIYAKAIALLKQKLGATAIKGMVHITGAGITGNLPRVLPKEKNLMGQINTNSWQFPPLLKHLQQLGAIDANEMMQVFNCGVGFMVIVSADIVNDVLACLHEESTLETLIPHQNVLKPFVIGQIIDKNNQGTNDEDYVSYIR